MTTGQKVGMLIDGESIPEPSECFAVRGKTIVDLIHPLTGKTVIYGKTLEDVRAEKGYELAERMSIDEFCRGKAALQDSPVEWIETTEEKYEEMLNVLPPLCWRSTGFLVGEPFDHHALTGRARYQAYIRKGKQYFYSSRPMTAAEFSNETAVKS